MKQFIDSPDTSATTLLLKSTFLAGVDMLNVLLPVLAGDQVCQQCQDALATPLGNTSDVNMLSLYSHMQSS